MTQDLLTHAPTAVSTTPAGWYADPAEAGTLRWWSGAGWTEHTAMANPPQVQQPAAAAAPATATATAPTTATVSAAAGHDQTAAPMSRRELRELAQRSEASTAPASAPLFTTQQTVTTAAPVSTEAGLSADTAPSSAGTERQAQVIDLRDESGYVDVSIARAPVSVFTPLWPTRVHTVAAWLIAVLPLLLAAAEKASSILLADVSLLVVRLAGAGLLILLSGILAIVDRHMLRAGGHSDTASPGWTLLTPFAYLIARSVRVRQETGVRLTGPALIWVVSLLPAIAMIVGVARLEAMIPGF